MSAFYLRRHLAVKGGKVAKRRVLRLRLDDDPVQALDNALDTRILFAHGPTLFHAPPGAARPWIRARKPQWETSVPPPRTRCMG